MSIIHHPDDPRAYCHCRLEKRPVAECESGKCKKVAPRTKAYWRSDFLDHRSRSAGVGEGNRWTERRG